MNIFFAGAVRGGRAHQPEYAAIVRELGRHGTVLTGHVADETVSDYGETDLSKEQIHARETDALRRADVVVADVTAPSLGVGYLVGQAVVLGKRVVCLYGGTDTYRLSAMIKGDPRVEVRTYERKEDVAETVAGIFR